MSVPPPSDAAAVHKALERRFAEEVLDGHDLGVLPELVAEDFVEQNPPPGQGPGREGLRTFLGEMFEAFPDLRWGIEDMVAEGDRVAARSTWTGTHRGAFFGVPATGRRVAVEAWTLDHYRDGKLSESRIMMDVMGLMQQLGAIPGGPGDNSAATPGAGRQ